MEVAEFMANNNQFCILCEQEELGGTYTTRHDLVLLEALQYGQDFEKHLIKFQSVESTYTALESDRSTLIPKLKARESDRLKELKSEYTKNPNIEVIYGQARFISPTLVEIKTSQGRELISFEHCVCAVGKQDVQVPYIPGSDEERIWNEFSIFQADDLPQSIAIIGCTQETMDFAFLYANLGIKVHIFESKRADACLPKFDKTILNIAFKRLLSKHVEFHFQSEVREIKKSRKNLKVITEAQEIAVSDILLATKKLFADTINAKEIGLKSTPNGLVTTADGRVYGGENIYAVGEANERFDLGSGKELLHNCLFSISQEFKKNKSRSDSTNLAITQSNSDPEYLKFSSEYPRILGYYEGVTIGETEYEARTRYGSIIRSEAYETNSGDIVKITYNLQTEKILGIAISGWLSKECLLFSLYCVDHKKKLKEFTTYLRNFLDLL